MFAVTTATLSVSPNNISKQVGDTFTVTVILDPHQNHVSFTKFDLVYDPNLLATTSAVELCNDIPCTIQTGLHYSNGKLSTDKGINYEKTTETKIATITFKILAPITSTQISLQNVQALAVDADVNPSDNVLYQTFPASVTTNSPADIDRNGAVDIIDFNILISCYGAKLMSTNCGSYKDKADLDNNGSVDGTDYNLFLRSIVQSHL